MVSSKLVFGVSQTESADSGPDHSAKPRVSVITVVRNASEAIAGTMKSVAAQSDVFEHLLIDGGSTDGTLETINRLAGPRCRVVSEPDRGIYDAMNKGLRMARGDWLIFMNAGDCFSGEHAIADAIPHMAAGRDLLLGETIMVFKDSLETRQFHSVPKSKSEWWKGMPACHQSVFYRRSVVSSFPFDLRYTWCADYDQFVSLISGGHQAAVLPFVVSIYDANGAIGRDAYIYIRERREISRRLLADYRQCIFYTGEFVRLALGGPVVRMVQWAMPNAWRLKLRRIRGTEGVSSGSNMTA